MSAATLIIGLLLPWAVGSAALFAARDTGRALGAPGELAWLAGAGYLGGAVLLTLWMRALSAVGVEFGIAAIGLPLVAAGVAFGYVGARRHRGQSAAAIAGAWRPPGDVAGIARVAWWALLAWTTLRFALLALEVAWEPVFPWDAWTQWATKARVWFELRRMVPFVDAGQWLAAGGTAWFDAGPGNPATLPLLQVWSCIALGRWDDALMNWPWWQAAVALALVSYGGLRRLGAGALAALFGAAFVASLPLANVHVALAGYPELPLAAFYTTAVLGFLSWATTRAWRDGVQAALFAAACPLIDNTGTIFALTVLPGVVVALAPRRGGNVVAVAFAVALFGLAVLAQTSPVVAGHALHLEFAPEWSDLAESLFLQANWNLLGYGVVGAVALTWRQLRTPALLPLATIAGAGLFYVLVIVAFPTTRTMISGTATVNRQMLPLAPVLAVFMLLAFRAFAARWREAHVPPAPPASPEAPPPAFPEALAPALPPATAAPD
jgi:hypothetical protein